MKSFIRFYIGYFDSFVVYRIDGEIVERVTCLGKTPVFKEVI